MTIAVDIRSLGDKNLTGVGTYVLGMLEGLTATGPNSNEAITLWYSGGSIVRGLIRQRVQHLPFPRYEIATPNKILKLGMLFSGALLSKRLSQFDFHWLPNINFFQRSDVPYALTVHDLSFIHNPYFYSLKPRLSHRIISSQKLLQHAHLIIAVSNATKEDVIRFFPSIPLQRIVVIPPGPPLKNTSRLVVAPYVPERYILFVGTIEPRKNVHALLNAFDMVSRIDQSLHLVLAGGQGWSHDHSIQRFENNPKIHWLGFVSAPQKDYLYAHAQAFVWPSFYEGYGFPPIEALQNNIPIVTSYRTSLPEILGPHAFYVNPYNPSELASVILSILRRSTDSQRAYAPSQTWRESALQFIDAIRQRV